MDQNTILPYATTGVLVCWMILGMIFVFVLLRAWRRGSGSERSRDPKARTGMLLQAVGFAFAWFPSELAGLNQSHLLIAAAASTAALMLAVGSLLLMTLAFWKLDRQWAVAARILEDHSLITTGVYSLVRHPIYTGLFGMMIATGLTHTGYLNLIFAILLYLIGFQMRIKVEEKLLLEAFGRAYEEYRSAVPPLIPRFRRAEKP